METFFFCIAFKEMKRVMTAPVVLMGRQAAGAQTRRELWRGLWTVTVTCSVPAQLSHVPSGDSPGVWLSGHQDWQKDLEKPSLHGSQDSRGNHAEIRAARLLVAHVKLMHFFFKHTVCHKYR